MKKVSTIVFATVFSMLILTACGGRNEEKPSENLAVDSEITDSADAGSELNSTDSVEQELEVKPLDESDLIWKVEPNLEYEIIKFFPGEQVFLGYPYTEYDFMDQLNEKTGEVVTKVGGRCISYPYIYGYYSVNDEFYCYSEASLWPVEKDSVDTESQNTTISVNELFELDKFPYYLDERGKQAIFCNGKFVTDYIYDEVIGGNSIAFINLGGKYGFANADGNELTDFIYDEVALIAKGYVAVRMGETWGFVDEQGNEILPYIFEHAVNIDENTAFVKYHGKYGILDVIATVG